MATTATVGNKSLWAGGVAPLKASYGKLMMWFFLLSDAFTFSGLLIAYAFIRWSAPAYKGNPDDFVFSTEYWPIPEKVYDAFPGVHGQEWPLVFVGLMTFILILSSVTMVLAVEAGQRMDKKGVVKWMLWTIIGGIAFLSCQAWEWAHFISGSGVATIGDVFINGRWVEDYEIMGAGLSFNQYGPPAFAALFFFITGFHGFHVLSGVVINIITFFNAANGMYEKRGHYEMIEKVGLYWHFVDLVWVFVFTFFYLI
ncbi:cytochrome c oxidase subunit 3 [Roseivirga seohaensis]|mgnify:FL=1|uniref:Cytochrome oxidase subunit III n=2 Tax=Roseivirga seohaensis TaxID=1914963 RepID=A0A0L8AID5_9BACT|nr:cytochrome c oxidase subunit 3 [Roseivirga seohaensis]KOF02158.1 cytochrome oxidase subunit III [Roseivirga seohaensis subsp. aquiponti]KYG79784.1 cytochrome oxidase subunit III [Roseivirga seohaensis]